SATSPALCPYTTLFRSAARGHHRRRHRCLRRLRAGRPGADPGGQLHGGPAPAQRAPAAGVAGTEGADRALVADVSAEPPPVADGARLRRLDRRADARGGTTVEVARLGAATAPDRRAGRAAIGQASVRPQPGTVCPGRARLRATAPWWLSGSGAGRW